MGSLAISTMNIKGQVGTVETSRSALNSSQNAAFVTELDARLQAKTEPAPPPVVSQPGPALRLAMATSVAGKPSPEPVLQLATAACVAGKPSPEDALQPAMAASVAGKPSPEPVLQPAMAASVGGKPSPEPAWSPAEAPLDQDLKSAAAPSSVPGAVCTKAQTAPVESSSTEVASRETEDSASSKQATPHAAEPTSQHYNPIPIVENEPDSQTTAVPAKGPVQFDGGVYPQVHGGNTGPGAVTSDSRFPSVASNVPALPTQETIAPAQNPLRQLVPPESSVGADPRKVSSQHTVSTATPQNPTKSAGTGSAWQPSSLTQTTTGAQLGATDVAGSPGQTGAARAANSLLSSNKPQRLTAPTLSPSQNDATQVVFQERPSTAKTIASAGTSLNASIPRDISPKGLSPLQNVATRFDPQQLARATITVAPASKSLNSSLPQAITPKQTSGLVARSLSRSNKGSQNTIPVIGAPLTNEQTQVATPVPSKQAAAPDATPPNLSNQPSLNPLNPLSSLRNGTEATELQNTAGDGPKSGATQSGASTAPSANRSGLADATSLLPSEPTQAVESAPAELGVEKGAPLALDRSATSEATSRSGPGNGLQGGGVEPSLGNLQNGSLGGRPEPTFSNQYAGLGTSTVQKPNQSRITHSQPQPPYSAPPTGADQQINSAAGRASQAVYSTGPEFDDPTINTAPLDFSLPVPFGLTKSESPGGENGSASSSRTKDSPSGNSAAPRTIVDARSTTDPGLGAQGPPPTGDRGAAFAVHDTKQAEASSDKNDGQAAPNLTKAAEGNQEPPKTTSDPAVALSPSVPGQTPAGRAATGVVGPSQGRSEPDQAPPFAGTQSNLQGAIGSARFTQQAGNAAMQVRLRSEALGPIDVQAVVKGSEVGASIRVEARDTQAMMSSELPQLEQALNERNLRVQRLDVLQGWVSGNQSSGAGGSDTQGSPSDARPGDGRSSVAQTYPALADAPIIYDDAGLGLSTTRINLRV